jgi:hypothetical protein
VRSPTVPGLDLGAAPTAPNYARPADVGDGWQCQERHGAAPPLPGAGHYSRESPAGGCDEPPAGLPTFRFIRILEPWLRGGRSRGFRS